MHQYFLTGSGIGNGRRPGPTVVILLTLVEDASPFTRTYPARVQADLGANGKRPGPTGTVANLLRLVEDGAGSPVTRAHAARVLANLGAVEALPTLLRLARFSPETEVRAAAREACERISRERQTQQPSGNRQGFWRRLENALRNFLGHPCW